MKLVIKQHRPLRRALIVIGFGCAMLLALAVVFDYGHWASIASSMVKTGRKGSLLDEVQELRAENRALQFEMARLTRAGQIAKFSRRDDQAQTAELQSKIVTLSREVAFYRDVLGGTKVASRTELKGVLLTPLAEKGRFSYRLVLTHVDKDNHAAEGVVRMVLKGEIDGRERALKFTEFAEPGAQDLSYKFKNFRLFEGTIRLPEGFIPRELEVAVNNTAPTRGAVTETYDWAAVLN